MIYYIKFVNDEELEINADGYGVYHQGKVVSFYTEDSHGRTTVVDVMTDNVLFVTRGRDERR